MAGDVSRANGRKGGRPKGRSAKTVARQRGRERALRQAEITAERTILELGRLAFTDRRGVWGENGQLKPFDQWTADQAALLEGFEVIVKNAEAGDGHTDRVHKVHLSKKIPALDILAKYFGLEVQKVEVSGKVLLEQLVAASMIVENGLVTGQKK